MLVYYTHTLYIYSRKKVENIMFSFMPELTDRVAIVSDFMGCDNRLKISIGEFGLWLPLWSLIKTLINVKIHQ